MLRAQEAGHSGEYNEFVVPNVDWERHLPTTIEAVVYTSDRPDG